MRGAAWLFPAKLVTSTQICHEETGAEQNVRLSLDVW